MNEYQQKKLDQLKNTLKQLNALGGAYKFELITDKADLDRSEIVLTGLIPINVSYNEYQKQYNFFLRHNLLYVKYETEKKVKEGLKEPQNVGVLTTNKIKAWVEYLIKTYEQLVEISKERTQTVDTFRAEVEKLGARISKDNNPYAPKDGTFSGEIVKNGIEFKFQVYNEGFISKEIEIHYSVQDSIDSFLKLSDNKYINTKE